MKHDLGEIKILSGIILSNFIFIESWVEYYMGNFLFIRLALNSIRKNINFEKKSKVKLNLIEVKPGSKIQD